MENPFNSPAAKLGIIGGGLLFFIALGVIGLVKTRVPSGYVPAKARIVRVNEDYSWQSRGSRYSYVTIVDYSVNGASYTSSSPKFGDKLGEVGEHITIHHDKDMPAKVHFSSGETRKAAWALIIIPTALAGIILGFSIKRGD